MDYPVDSRIRFRLYSGKVVGTDNGNHEPVHRAKACMVSAADTIFVCATSNKTCSARFISPKFH
jgi:hypothetical protein